MKWVMCHHDGVGAVVLAPEHLSRLGGFDLLLQLRQALGEIHADVLAGSEPLDQHREIVAATLQRAQQRQVVVDAPPLLHHLLRGRLVAPEAGGAYLGFEIGELGVEACRLKDASAVPPIAD